MSLDTIAPGDVSAPASAPAPVSVPADTSPISARDAASALAKRRWEKPAPESQAAPVDPVEPPKELADEANAALPEVEATGETQEADPAEKLPTIEPPRSWTKEEKERFNSYPRELQAYLSEREQERDRAVRHSQNEAAEKLKGLTAKEQQVEQARQQYESALPALYQTLQEQQAGAFSDIRTMADVQRLSEQDPFRYIQWTAHQQKVSAVQQEMQAAQSRQAQDFQSRWNEWSTKEDTLVAERLPELADPAQRGKIQEGAISYLKDLGFSETELGKAWNGQASISPRDHRFQVLVRDAVKYRESQEQARKALATAKPLPPVQKPGVAPARGAGNAQLVQTLSAKLDQTGSIKDAAKLLMARRAANSR